MLKGLNSGVTMSLTGKVALITGGSRGIGAATVRLFHQAGAKVVFNYRSAARQAEALVAECGGPDLCHAIHQPLNTPEDGAALVAAATAVFGRIDCAILNHGIWPPHDAPISEMTTDQWRSTLGTNLDSVFGVIRAAVAQMKSQPKSGPARGHIVLISSTAGQRGEAFHADYAATKGALISLTKSLSTELIGQGIYCNCVAPGLGRHRRHHAGPQRPRDIEAAPLPHTPRPPRSRRRDRGTHSLSLHSLRRLHLRRDLQRQRWRGTRRLNGAP